MSPTTNSKMLLPHEIDQIDQIFKDVLRGLGLSRNSEAAEAIAVSIRAGPQDFERRAW